MAPKGTAKAPSAKVAQAKQAKESAAALALALSEKEAKKKEQSTMLTGAKSLAKSSKPDAADAVAFLTMYDKLDRFSQEKTKLLEEWKAAKGFSFMKSYTKTTEVMDQTTKTGHKGYGTKYP
jgi:hypothetical protein